MHGPKNFKIALTVGLSLLNAMLSQCKYWTDLERLAFTSMFAALQFENL